MTIILPYELEEQFRILARKKYGEKKANSQDAQPKP